MTDKEMKKLKRVELLEMLLDEKNENKKLRKQLDEANAKLAERDIKLKESGSIAEASLKLNDVFEAAQNAVEQYLENVMRLYPTVREGDDKGEEEK